ncbi:MAG: DNA-3-methyladenine glycosylase I [Bacteroidales bacterium]|nr:DNA-3-methyladenine glycosylase I [Bacteroidales bacterium]
MELIKCGWAKKPLDIEYHDKEWGVPVHDDTKLFEYLVLDAFQAGLSWSTILNKRENFRKAFDNFDSIKISNYKQEKIDELIQDKSIVRNKLKINGTVKNAKAFIKVQQEFGSFDKYIWSFTGGKTIVNNWKELNETPATSVESDAMSKDLKKRGFTFVGSTICYAFMQAAGIVNDHLISCFRYKEVGNDK